MIDQVLRPVLEHPKRVWIVTIITFLIAVVFTWPAVDFYFAAAEKRADLESDLQQSEELVSKLDLYKNQIEKKNAVLSTLEKRILTTKELERFREQLVEWVKASGCKLRRIKLAESRVRPWYDDDDPFDNRVRSDKDKKSAFKLQTQQINVLVTGPLEKVVEFLTQVSEQDRMLHTGNFQLRKSTEDNSLVEMDLELILFDLVQGGDKT
jgi:Tfp pilus assembly protein PilO